MLCREPDGHRDVMRPESKRLIFGPPISLHPLLRRGGAASIKEPLCRLLFYRRAPRTTQRWSMHHTHTHRSAILHTRSILCPSPRASEGSAGVRDARRNDAPSGDDSGACIRLPHAIRYRCGAFDSFRRQRSSWGVAALCATSTIGRRNALAAATTPCWENFSMGDRTIA